MGKNKSVPAKPCVKRPGTGTYGTAQYDILISPAPHVLVLVRPTTSFLCFTGPPLEHGTLFVGGKPAGA